MLETRCHENPRLLTGHLLHIRQAEVYSRRGEGILTGLLQFNLRHVAPSTIYAREERKEEIKKKKEKKVAIVTKKGKKVPGAAS